MKRCITVIGVLCLTVSLIGCQANVLAGSQATVELKGNPTTGYTWIHEIANPDIIKEVAYEYISDQEDDDVVGVGGTFIFTFKGLAEGETEITFNYQRPWEEDVEPEETITYAVVVDGNHEVTLTKIMDSCQE
jgi:predicted secreted protein